MRNWSIFRVFMFGMAIAMAFVIAAGICTACGGANAKQAKAEDTKSKSCCVVQEKVVKVGSDHPRIDTLIARAEQVEDVMDARKAAKEEFQAKRAAIRSGNVVKTTTRTAVFEEQQPQEPPQSVEEPQKAAAYHCTCTIPQERDRGLFGRR